MAPGVAADAGAVRILRLEIDNFKSYKGHQVIGPFKSFTSIIGPNGSGKSNLMDAISFVLGVRSSQLRSGTLRELVYGNKEDPGHAARRASVTMVLGYEGGGTEIHFTRGIAVSGTSEYRHGNRVVTAEAYNEHLKAHGILVKARNFLVFQGDVQNIASKEPVQLTAMLEEVSGAAELKPEYDALEAAKTAAEEKATYHFARRKGLLAEKRQKREQKDEAERYLTLMHAHREATVEHALFTLLGLSTDLASARAAVAKHAAAAAAVERAHAVADKAVADKAAVVAKATKEMLLADKAVAKKKADLEKLRPAAVSLKEEASRAAKRAKTAEIAASTTAAEVATASVALDRLRSDLDAASLAQEAFEADVARKAAAAGGALRLEAAQATEYARLKEQAGAATFKLAADRAVADSTLRAEKDALAAAEASLADIATRTAALAAERDKAAGRADSLRVSLAAAVQEQAALKAKASELAESSRRARLRSEAVAAQLESVEAALRDARADRKEGEKEAKQAEAVASLRALLPGGAVRGRLVDLVTPTHRRYNLALTVALGKSMDAVVVADDKAARECIAHLKDRRLPPMTFIPLATITAKPVDARLRAASAAGTLGGPGGGRSTAKLLLDCAEYDPSLEKAMLYALGAALVADTVNEARALAYGGPERHKVVALDGTLLSKAGIITGGASGGLEDRAARLDRSAIDALKAQRAAHVAELASLAQATGRDAVAAQADVAARLAALDRSAGYMHADAAAQSTRASALTGEISALEAEAARRRPEAARAAAEVGRKEKALAKLDGRIHEITDGVFARFSASVGVASIREYEDGRLAASRAVAEERARLETHVARLRNAADYEARRDASASLAKAKTAAAAAAKDAAAVAAKASAAAAAADVGTAELAALAAAASTAKSAAEASETEKKAMAAGARSHTAELGAVKKAAAAAEARVAQLTARQADVIREAAMAQLELPGMVTAAAATGAADAGTSASTAAAAGAAAASLDFSGLPRKLQAVATGGSASERDKAAAELRAAADGHAAALAQLAPNQKAVEQFEAVKAKERQLAEELDAAKAAAQAAGDAFASTRDARLRRFMACFTHVTRAIDPVYKELTRSARHPSGGQAYLALESPDDPFLHGVKFTAMPPAKRFRDIELLSGGEKTVAALALLFAVHSFKPSPFFILDEVDANLDNENIAKVAHYIRGRSHAAPGAGGPAPFQSVVISLKDAFYDKADALIGVCRDPDGACSETYTLSLERFD